MRRMNYGTIPAIEFKKWRLSNGISQIKMSQLLEISYPSYVQLERGMNYNAKIENKFKQLMKGN